MNIITIILVSLSFAQDVVAAESLYKEKDYGGAIEAYSRIIDGGLNNAFINYNLGNCYFKRGEIGRAILYYKRAKKLLPTDSDIDFNLNFARSQRVDVLGTPDKPRFIKFIMDFPGRFSINGLTIFSSSLFFMIFVLLSISLLYNKRLIYNIIIGFVILLLLSLLPLCINLRERNIKEGVLIVQAQAVRSGPGEDYSLLFTLHEGAEFRILEEDEKYTRVVIESGFTGWIEKGSFEKV